MHVGKLEGEKVNLREALVTVIDYIREQGADDSPRMRQALKPLEKKAEALRVKRERMSLGRVCRQCGKGCAGLLCYGCWGTIPEELRSDFHSAKSDGDRTAACRAILELVVDRKSEIRNPKSAILP